MHTRMARLLYLLGGVERLIVSKIFGLKGFIARCLFNKCGLYLFISCFPRLRGASEAPLYNFKSVHDKATKIINKKLKCY